MTARRPGQPDQIIPAQDLFDWHVTKVPVKPYQDRWSFNPSIHFDGEIWRMAVRCADYGMPGGVQIRGPNADRFGVQTANVMVHLDPKTWKPVEIFPMHELDGLPRNKCGNRGFEDVRIFRTASGGLQGIAASSHLERDSASGQYPPEQVLLTLGDGESEAPRYGIIAAQPIRGTTWGGPQKNWSPFDGADEPRFLYSIDRGMVFGVDGPIAEPELAAPPIVSAAPTPTRVMAPLPVNGTEFRRIQRVRAVDAAALGRKAYAGLRGGTQLVHLDDGVWMGLGHEMRLERGRKLYWHRFYTVDSDGKLLSMSPSIKIAREGIEFAAGLVVHEGRVTVSFGVDDAECRIGVAPLADVQAVLEPVGGDGAEEATKPNASTRRMTLTTSAQTRTVMAGPTLVVTPTAPNAIVTPATDTDGGDDADPTGTALTDGELGELDAVALREAYAELRDRHLASMSAFLTREAALYKRQASLMRAVGQAIDVGAGIERITNGTKKVGAGVFEVTEGKTTTGKERDDA